MEPPAANRRSAPPRPRGDELERALLERCVARDPIAFRAFVVRYERVVFALLSRLVGRGPHVEDLAQETFLRAYRAFPTFDLEQAAKPSTWLLTIATRLALDARKRKTLPLAPKEDGDAREDGRDDTTPETERRRRELGIAISKAASELGDDQRAAFLLAELHGLSIAEIAAALDVPENTAKTRLFRARQHMRDKLDSFNEARGSDVER